MNRSRSGARASALPPGFYPALLILLSIPALGQNGVPHTPDGHPDLSGIWTNVTITPFERPRDLAGKEFFTEQEAAAWEKNHISNRDIRETRGTDADVSTGYNDFWWDSGTRVVKTRRTSIVIDPADGRVPPLTSERQKQLQAIADARKRRCAQPGCEMDNGGQPGPADGPEDRSLGDRCLSVANAVPMLPSAYNNNYEIVQTPAEVGIAVEMFHQSRRIPLDGSPHLSATVRQWDGDSRGRWEGDTLVIDTTNFTDKTAFRGSDENLHLVERLTRTDADTIIYRFTVDDPTAFTKPWAGEIPFVKTAGPLYEYACHEGNVGMTGILSGARADEKKAAEGSKKGGSN